VQSNRLDIYRKHAEQLLDSGVAYRCFCTPERLEEMRAGQQAAKQPMMYDKKCRSLSAEEVAAELAKGTTSVVRMKMPMEGVTTFIDSIRGEVSFENALIDDQVLVKTDGFPTYHLAVVVDDHLMGITHVFRGEEWLPSTPKHIQLYKAFGWEPTVFAHLPLLLNADRSKLSKRQGDVAVEDYLKKGYLPEALLNFVALLGWNPTGDREVYSKEEMAELFSLDRVNKAGAVFNLEKLDWLNKEYMRSMSAAELAKRAAPFYMEAGLDTATGDALERAVSLEQRRVATLAEFPEATRFLFEEISVDAAMLPGKKGTPETAKDRLVGMREWLANAGDDLFAESKTLETAALAHVAEKGWTNGETLWPLRVALTGREASPSPFEVAWALGKERTLLRVDAAIAVLG
jgi:glutamyl-tRNA synthetase